ncbi:hypothetical protein XBP1_1760018 [Xenorhabdus bovienii str. puntauvense]|uniref:Uncharacterized protein n=3 Tax=Xenorhabdus bovienii TaxID=40576 RepID=A0A077NCB4_XENBV|nr:hypothetical protein XBFFR1_2420048 [Xenorhabdus bovienii str. feltiae France]CDG94915.1 hypothetical protein XBFFL1_930003 [Xenorhabdus bovienii str. feltiae Florida]CDG95948.1 hypothetical protein XBP1_1760018 [Xenorhabdus bovienii str. puntauvense]CDG99683.1 hypothetical protein XBFM1_1100069 [Xenorhabdus bovienii str. feltiae Moldova]CDH24616.1 hypothetical protein XBKB1_2990038 [Xenorhabdus bovienii str. kraussei Becker Underwood]
MLDNETQREYYSFIYHFFLLKPENASISICYISLLYFLSQRGFQIC